MCRSSMSSGQQMQLTPQPALSEFPTRNDWKNNHQGHVVLIVPGIPGWNIQLERMYKVKVEKWAGFCKLEDVLP